MSELDREDLPERLARARRHPGGVADYALDRASRFPEPDEAATHPAENHLRRVRRALLRACRELKRDDTAVFLFVVGIAAAVRRALAQARTRTAEAANVLGATFASAGNLITAAAVATTLLAGPALASTQMVAAAYVPTLTTRTSSISPQRTGRSESGPPHYGAGHSESLGASVEIPAPGSSAKAATHITHQNRRLNATGALQAWLGPEGKQIYDGPLFWIDCDPASVLKSTLCTVVDLIPPPPAQHP